jgi:hypothetical protein
MEFDLSNLVGIENFIISGIMAVLITFSALIVYILQSFLMGRIFKKAGVRAWKAWVPFYNYYKLFQLGGHSGGWALLPLFIAAISPLLLFLDCNDEWSQTENLIILGYGAIVCLTVAIFLIKYLEATWNIAKKLGKSGVYMLLLFVNIGPSMWYWILGLDKSVWKDKLGRKSLAKDNLK